MRQAPRLVDESGAGTVLALGIVTVILGLTLLFLNIGNGTVERARLAALADNASIAAADALRGLIAGYPCEVAKSLAPVTSCVIEGNDVLVEISRNGITARARAGEPN